jgi:hypothetical protein
MQNLFDVRDGHRRDERVEQRSHRGRAQSPLHEGRLDHDIAVADEDFRCVGRRESRGRGLVILIVLVQERVER